MSTHSLSAADADAVIGPAVLSLPKSSGLLCLPTLRSELVLLSSAISRLLKKHCVHWVWTLAEER